MWKLRRIADLGRLSGSEVGRGWTVGRAGITAEMREVRREGSAAGDTATSLMAVWGGDADDQRDLSR